MYIKNGYYFYSYESFPISTQSITFYQDYWRKKTIYLDQFSWMMEDCRQDWDEKQCQVLSSSNCSLCSIHRSWYTLIMIKWPRLLRLVSLSWLTNKTNWVQHILLESAHQFPPMVNVSYNDEMHIFRPNLALRKWKNGVFSKRSQNWFQRQLIL